MCVCVGVCVSGKCAYSDIQTFNQYTNHDKHRNYVSNFNNIETRSTENAGRRDAWAHSSCPFSINRPADKWYTIIIIGGYDSCGNGWDLRYKTIRKTSRNVNVWKHKINFRKIIVLLLMLPHALLWNGVFATRTTGNGNRKIKKLF